MIVDKKKEILLIDAISDVCAEYFHIKVSDLYSRKVKRTESLARHLLWYVLHTEYGIASSTLAKEFFRSRRHIFFGINKIRQGAKVQKFYSDLIIGFNAQIEKSRAVVSLLL